jgi:hypothetical protein
LYDAMSCVAPKFVATHGETQRPREYGSRPDGPYGSLYDVCTGPRPMTMPAWYRVCSKRPDRSPWLPQRVVAMCLAVCGARLADGPCGGADVAGLAVVALSSAAPMSDAMVMAVARVRQLAPAPM